MVGFRNRKKGIRKQGAGKREQGAVNSERRMKTENRSWITFV
jgi:hypothetical protein